MKLTLVIASYNGAKTLGKVLDSYVLQHVPVEHEFALVVVDNASTDNTKMIIEQYQDKLPLHYIYEAKPGKNAALNKAVANITTDVFLFTDDDVIPNKHFIENWFVTLEKHPEFDLYGGRVNPCYPISKPDWLTLEWVEMVCFAKSKSDLQTGPVNAGEIFGNNMLVKADLFKYGVFDENTGPSPTSYGMGSETEFNTRMSQEHQAKAYFNSENSVEHLITEQQMSLAWVLGRAEKFGRGQAYLEAKFNPYQGAFIFGLPRYLLSKLLVCWYKSKVSQAPELQLKQAWDFHETKGRIAAYRMFNKSV